jgi:hypothetical protein
MKQFEFGARKIVIWESSPSLSALPVVDYVPKQLHYTFPETLEHLGEIDPYVTTPILEMDFGGVGDCFVRCYHGHNRYFLGTPAELPLLSGEQIYQLMDIEMNTWFEDIHLSMLCNSLGITIYIISEMEGKWLRTRFGGYGPALLLRNLGNYHYTLLVSNNWIGFNRERSWSMLWEPPLFTDIVNPLIPAEIETPVVQEEPEVPEIPDIEIDPEDETEEPTPWGDSGSDSGNEIMTEVLSPLPPNPSLQLVYAYMRNISIFECKSEETALLCFRILHYTILDLICDAELKEANLPGDFLKFYYKFRHDIFCFLCLRSMGLTRLGTDVPLSNWIDSIKTPDYILDTDQFHIFEFTVSNRYGTADYNKGGGIFDVKYSSEAEQISEKLGKRVQVHIVSAILDSYNVTEIMKEMEPFSVINQNTMRNFFEICNIGRSSISNAYFNSGRSKLGVSIISGTEEPPQLMSTIMLDPKLVSAVFKNWDWLFKYVESLAKKFKKPRSIAIRYDRETGNTKIEIDPKKLKCFPFEKARAILRDKRYNEALSHMNFFSGSTPISISDVRGDVPVTIQRPKVSTRRYNWSYPTFAGTNYRSEKIVVEDDYVTLEHIDWDTVIAAPSIKFNFGVNYFNDLLFNDYFKVIASPDKAFLANNIISEDYLKVACDSFAEEYKTNNEIQYKLHAKQTFMIPLVTVPLKKADLESVHSSILETYLQVSLMPYTTQILSRVRDNKYVKKVDTKTSNVELKFLYSEARRAYFTEKAKIPGNKFEPGYKEKLNVSVKILELKKNMIKAQRDYSLSLRGLKSVEKRIVRVPCGKNTFHRKSFEAEMLHFQKENKGIKGVGKILNPEDLMKYFSEFVERLIEKDFHDNTFPSLYNRDRGPGPDLLTDDKNHYTQRWDQFYEHNFKGTLLEQLSQLGSNLARLLFNEGTKTYNSDFVKVDNLGFEDILVLVRGGPKSHANNLSRLFKVIFYMNRTDLKYSGYEENQFFETHSFEDRVLVATPWSHLHLDVLYDWFSLRERVFMNLFSNHTRCGIPLTEKQDKLNVMPSMLALHNRRKTEKLLHNTRYLIVNPMGQYSNIHSIIKSFGTFNVSYFDAWLKECILDRYLNFSLRVMKFSVDVSRNLDTLILSSGICDLWFGEPFRNVDQVTLFIYITYMMTKAPVNSSVEQAINLKEILSDVDLYETEMKDVDKMDDSRQHIDVLNFRGNEYKNDFNYDPKFCQFLGFYGSGILRNRCEPYEIDAAWKRISSMGLSKIANSNGLRGFNNSNYFSRKGYEVVYDYVIESMQGQDIELEKLVKSYLELDMKAGSERVRSEKLTCAETVLNKATFHIVHKLQRGGNREIFCMDLFTKSKQAPIEKFWAFLCSKMQNEYISIPSSKRHSMIHTDFFEKKTSQWVKTILRWVLDCRRWAPHSVIQKYIHFLHGLSLVLPQDFVDWCEDLLIKMLDKEFVTRGHVYKTIERNKSYEHWMNLMKEDPIIKDKYNINVRFSFVMGIFNYMSSFMHATNQIVASEIIMSYNLTQGNGLVMMDPKAHSDDSVITSYHEKDESVYPSVKLYDWLLKCSNHMLSVKKSQVNRNVYLEFLSILYLFDRFVPVIPKFLSSIPFKPTDQGYSSDVSFSITQAIEVMSNGGTIEESFLILKLTERYIQSIYNLTPNKNLPYCFLGMVDCHPTELLLSGTQSEIIKSMRYAPEHFWKAHKLLSDQDLIDPTDPTNLSVKWDMTARRAGRLISKYRGFEQVSDRLNNMFPWTLEKGTLGNEYLSFIWYVNKLKDPKYYSSMVMEPDSRRFSRAFGSAKYRQVMKLTGELVSVAKLSTLLKDLDDIPLEFSTSDAFEVLMNSLNSDLNSWFDSLDGASWSHFEKPSGFKDKPVHFSFNAPELGTVRMKSADIVTYLKEPNAFSLLGLSENPKTEVSKVTSYLSSLGFDHEKLTHQQLFLIIQKILGKDGRGHRLIAPVPSQYKRIDTYTGMLVYLCHNSVKGVIRECVSISASRVDWKRRVLSGRVPEAVLDFLESSKVEEMMKKHSILNLDIYKNNPKDVVALSFSNVPTEWRPMVSSAISQHQGNLIDENYWVWWVKDQIKINFAWYGEGITVVKVPEVLMRFSTSNGFVNTIEIQENKTFMFSDTSGWFLKNLTSLTGMSLRFENSEYGEPNCFYYGQHISTNSFGIGPPNKFDRIFPKPVIFTDLVKGFMYENCFEKKEGRYHYYRYNLERYKIEFLVPTADLPNINLDKYLDKGKVKSSILVKEVRDFLFMMSQELRSEYAFDRDQVVDTIGYSTVYRILYESSVRDQLMRNEQVYEPFVIALMEWKKVRPEFEFPTEEEIVEMAKRTDLPPLPAKIYNHIVKIGRSTISKESFSNILTTMLTIEQDKRMQYLLSMFPQLNDDERNNAVVLAIRDTRLYSSCKFLGRDTFRILTPLCETLLTAVENNIFSETLTELSRTFSTASNPLPPVTVLKMILARLVMTGMYSVKVLSTSDRLASLFYSILEELCNDGLGKKMEIYSMNQGLLSSVKFDVENEKIIDLFIDVFDSLYLSGWYGRPLTKRQWVREDKFETQTSFFKKSIIQLAQFTESESIKISTKVSKTKTENLTVNKSNPIPGLFLNGFVPLDEDDQDELSACADYDSDAEENMMFESKGTAKQIGYVSIRVLDRAAIWKSRGSGFTLFANCDIVTRDVLKAKDKLIFYTKKNYSSLLDMLNSFGKVMVCFTQKNKNFSVEDYERRDYMDFFKGESKYRSKDIEIDGVKYSKLDVLKDSFLNQKIETIDQYFKHVSTKTAEQVVETSEKNLEIIKEANIIVSKDYEDAHHNLSRKLKEWKQKNSQEPKTEEEVEERQKMNWAEEIGILVNQLKISEIDVPRSQAQVREYKFESPLTLNRSPKFIGEFNALFAGLHDKFERNELFLTKAAKKSKIRAARSLLKEKSHDRDLMKRYSQLYLITMAVLNSVQICESVVHQTHELSEALDVLWSGDDEEFDIENLSQFLIPPTGEFIRDIDIDRLF